MSQLPKYSNLDEQQQPDDSTLFNSESIELESQKPHKSKSKKQRQMEEEEEEDDDSDFDSDDDSNTCRKCIRLHKRNKRLKEDIKKHKDDKIGLIVVIAFILFIAIPGFMFYLGRKSMGD